jgi:hypothetical protein
MSDLPPPVGPQRKLWVRALLMLVMAAAFQLAATVLVVVAVLQLILSVAESEANARLARVGRSIGRYLAQIARFVSFASEQVPFPFSDWPDEGAAGRRCAPGADL